MKINRVFNWFSKNIIKATIGIIILIITITIFVHGRYNSSDGLIFWDVKSYYSYLPATFIYHDLSFGFMEDGGFGKWIWPFETITGKKGIRATMGLSVMYAPFFFVGHLIALITPYEATGYSKPYHFALAFSSMFYLWLGLLLLAKVLRRFYADKVVAFTLFAVAIGTNLFFYTTREATMSHSFLFSLFALFLWLTVRFYEKPSIKRILLAGAVAGFITLVRPTNIIVLVVFFLWGISNLKDFRERLMFFIQRYYWVLLMASVFILVWVPQFFYWHYISGKIFYFTYGEAGGRFFFNNPQIYNILFSYKKGWLVYTPLMIFALIGFFMLPRRQPGQFLPLLFFKLINIYILASWWSWWFGGGFGLRAFVESYAFLALPFAAFVEFGYRQKKKTLRHGIIFVLSVLILFNQFQTRQYNNTAIHWWWMNKEAYWETFLKLRPTERFWIVVTLPDYEAARQGIYRELKSPQALEWERRNMEWFTWRQPIPEDRIILWLTQKFENDSIYSKMITASDFEMHGLDTAHVAKAKARELYHEKGYEFWDKEMAVEMIMQEVSKKTNLMKSIEKKALENDIAVDSQLVLDALWLFRHERK
jgi:hypothetical protein